MWNNKWSYREAFAITAIPILVGWVLQAFLGPMPRGAFAFPLNAIVGLITTLGGVIIAVRGYRRGQRPFLAGGAATIAVLVAFMLLTLIAGLTLQVSSTVVHGLPGLIHRLGFSIMPESRAFLLLYVYLLLVLSAATSYRLLRFRKGLRDVAFALNHVGLYIFLLFALISAADTRRYTMTVSSESEYPEWRAIDERTREMVELPIAIGLRSFEMDEYPPKVMLLDATTGDLLPKGRPTHIMADTKGNKGMLGEWQVEVVDALDASAPVVTAERIDFKEFHSTGSAAAALVRVTGRGDTYEGWVSCGSYLFPYRSLQLPDSLAIVMPEREPKQFTSHISYYIREGASGNATIRVNHPLRHDGWYIYQLGYDREKGKWSTTSDFELVYDRWLLPVYIGIGLMILGALCLLLGPLGHPKKK